MSISFTMKIRGVPFEAGEKEVFEVYEEKKGLIYEIAVVFLLVVLQSSCTDST